MIGRRARLSPMAVALLVACGPGPLIDFEQREQRRRERLLEQMSSRPEKTPEIPKIEVLSKRARRRNRYK